MQLPDVNALIYAHRQDAPEHHRYAARLRALVEAAELFPVAEILLAGFLRIATNSKIFWMVRLVDDGDDGTLVFGLCIERIRSRGSRGT